MARKNKNVSKKVPNGTIVQTRDNYFANSGNYNKPNRNIRQNYRKAVAVDSNRQDELALVKLTTSEKGIHIKGKSKIKPYIETKDNKGKPIKLSYKFFNSSSKDNLSKREVSKVKKECLKNARKDIRDENRRKLRELKRRK